MRHSPVVAQTGPADPKPVRDLADFLLRWQAFRPAMAALQARSDLPAPEAETLGWLIALTDRLRADDVI